MNFNDVKKLFSFGSSSSSYLALENKNKVEEKEKNNTKEVACKSPFIIPLKMDPNAFEEDNARTSVKNFIKGKENADPEKYFGLFAKHLKKFPDGGLGKRIALVDLSNVIVEKMIVNLNPKAEYVLIDNFLDYKYLKVICPEADLSLICADDRSILEQFEELQMLNIDMKFDIVVGNPPYDGNLHLKILAEVMKHLSDEGEVIWLAPIRWLQDPLAKYKKNSDYNRYENTISKKIISINEYAGDVISMLFDAGMPACGIYHLDNNIHDFYLNCFLNQIFEKTYSILRKKTKPIFEKNRRDGWRVKISPIFGGGTAGAHSNGKETLRNIGKLICFYDGIKDGKPWHAFYAHNGATKIQADIPYSIKFETEAEAKNFIDSYKTSFVKYYTHLVKRDVHVSPKILVWVNDLQNPRTGLKGYLSNWTDDDFYKIFNLTDDEIKLIEETIKE